jgi:hypothetical protein
MIVLYVIKNDPVYIHIHIFIAFNSVKYSNVSCVGSVIGGVCGLDNATCTWTIKLKAAMMEFKKVFFPYLVP